jgi:hypothetical protein
LPVLRRLHRRSQNGKHGFCYGLIEFLEQDTGAIVVTVIKQ